MIYEQQEFFDLIDMVEEQGGDLLEEMCKARKYEFTGVESRPVILQGCGNQALFSVPYEALDKNGNELGLHPAVVCAVDDDMGKWPRFGGDRYATKEDE
jgi:hypothetical protein